MNCYICDYSPMKGHFNPTEDPRYNKAVLSPIEDGSFICSVCQEEIDDSLADFVELDEKEDDNKGNKSFHN